jgi:transglutaminase-like putative cysteine protease
MIKGFIPTGDDIKRVLAGSSEVRVHPGADLIYLLDHSVEQVELDGSTRQFITQIVKAVNDTGRDKLTKYVLPRGRLRIKEAYAVAPDNSRREASSIRNGTVRFRELEVGSTIVVQYRLDTFPGGYLSRHLFRRWFFHGLGFQFADSHYVLLVPLEMQLTEFGRGVWDRSEKVQGDRKILEYRSRNVPPLVAEPFMPPMLDLLDQVVLSSIPDWDTIAGWDANLLVDAFRSTPEIKQLALDLTRTAKTKRDKLDAITRFVMREIRYQQDYENNIAGVKPHAAPVVLQRAYGDCKDKSVILMTLAKEVGIQTRFALLRTTGIGDFIKELPALQFNHAIVYVPAQKGMEEPMFIDATPDTLDIKTLRLDSQNTWALVIDPESNGWEFVRVPRTSAHLQYTLRKTKVIPKIDGMSHIEVTFTFQGPSAATVRTILRNPDGAKVFTANLANSLFPGSRVDDVLLTGEDDIVRPVTMVMTVSSEGLTRRQGKSVVVELPTADNIAKFISLTERKLPLQTSLFISLSETEDEVRIPEGYKVGFIPEGLKIDNPFFTFERVAIHNKKSILIKMRYVEKRSRITAEEYPAFRDAVSEILDSLGQDIILKPKR